MIDPKKLRYRHGDKVRFKNIPDPPFPQVVGLSGYVQKVHPMGIFDYHVGIGDQYFLVSEDEIEDIEGELYGY